MLRALLHHVIVGRFTHALLILPILVITVIAASCVTQPSSRHGALLLHSSAGRLSIGLTGCAEGERLEQNVDLVVATTPQLISGSTQLLVEGTLSDDGWLHLTPEAADEVRAKLNSAEPGSLLVLAGSLRTASGSLVDYQQGTPAEQLAPFLAGSSADVWIEDGSIVESPPSSICPVVAE